MYYCKNHPQEKLIIFNTETSEFICEKCIPYASLNFYTAKIIQESDIIAQAVLLEERNVRLQKALERNLEDLRKIRFKTYSLNQDEIQSTFSQASKLLTKAFDTDQEIVTKTNQYIKNAANLSKDQKDNVDNSVVKKAIALRPLYKPIVHKIAAPRVMDSLILTNTDLQ